MRLPLCVVIMLLLSIASCKHDPALPAKTMKVSVVLDHLYIPWGMAFLPNGDFLFCQRSGQLGLFKKGDVYYTELAQRTGLTTVGEGGLLGLTVDPDYVHNNYIYIYETLTTNNQVVRLKYLNGNLSQDRVILSNIPSGKYHDGGFLKFGPDGYLYIGTGDADVYDTAQNINNLAGKILRVDRDGNAAPGNPFNSPIWVYGNRNVQGFDWDAQGKMIETEHGPSGELGWHAHDEINYIQPGNNYGWPLYLAGTEVPPYILPILESDTVTWAPSGCTFLRGSQFPEWENQMLFGCLQGQRIIRLNMSADGTQVAGREDMFFQTYGRIRSVVQAPDGSIWFSSSNADSQNPQPLPGDDKIYRLSKE